MEPSGSCLFDALPKHLRVTILLSVIRDCGLSGLCAFQTASSACRQMVREAFDDVDVIDGKKDFAGVAPDRYGAVISGLVTVMQQCRQLKELDMSAAHRHLKNRHVILMSGSTTAPTAQLSPLLQISSPLLPVLAPVPALSNLQSLNFSYCTSITDAALQVLAESGLPQLKHLNIWGCRGLTGASFLPLLPSLTSLTANYCESLTAAAVASVAGRLLDASLTSCIRVDDSVCSGFTRVRILSLASTAVTDIGLLHLACAAPSLHTLVLTSRSYNLWSCGLYSERGLEEFQRLRPEVTVKLTHC